MTWTLIDPSAGATEYPTLGAALEAAKVAIEGELVDGEWSEDVAGIQITCGGEVTHRAIEVPVGPPNTSTCRWQYDQYCTYVMQAVRNG